MHYLDHEESKPVDNDVFYVTALCWASYRKLLCKI